VKAIVFPLEDAAQAESLEWLSDGVALSISEQIAGRDVEPMSRSTRIELIESLDLPPGAQLSLASMIRVAQQASADWVVMGRFAGGEASLRITVRVLNVKSLKLGGEIAANGPLSALPQLENELSWLILKNSGLEVPLSREQFAERMRKVPNRSYALYIDSLGQRGEKERLQSLLKAVEAYRNFPQAHFEIGRHYFRNGNCERALMHLNLGSGGEDDAAESNFMRGTCCLQANQPALAIQALSRIAPSFNSGEILNNLGVAHLRAGDPAQALVSLKEARALSPADAAVLLNIAVALHLQGNNAAAFECLEKAIKAHPGNGMLQFMLSVVLRAKNDPEKSDAAAGRARGLGVNVDKLRTEDPRSWSQVLFTWE
jgi:Flp pilus assembly protein TadD